MASFNRIGLVARVASDQVRESLLTVEQFLLSKGVEIVVEQVSAAALGGDNRAISSLEEMGTSCDLLIAVGGDGNILSTARVMAPFGVPILGINRGKLGFLADVSPDEIDERNVRKDLSDFIERFTSGPLGDVDMSSMLTAFMDGLRKHRIKCPGDLILMIKSLITIEGVGKQLSPTFNLIDYAKPTIEKLVKSQLSFGSIKSRSEASVLMWAQLAERLPDDATRLLDRIRRNRLQLNVEIDSVNQMTDAVDRSSRNISWALIIAALIVGSSIMVLANRSDSLDIRSMLGLFGYIFAGTLGVWRIIQHLRSGR